MTFLLFISALALSSIAAYYAIMGLMVIFSGAATSIAIMGVALEVSKIVVSSWLYRNWKETTLLLKTYFTIAILILMVLTSMGIFGYLSKAHSDQGFASGEVLARISSIDEKIRYQKEIIDDARKTIVQLDRQVDEAINRTSAQSTTAGVDRSVTIRRNQAKERGDIAKTISAAQAEIAKLNAEKAPIAEEARKVEAEVGPIKYVAALLYDDNPDNSTLERAVRMMIILIVIVFDPLAILMFIAVNQSMMRKQSVKIVEAPKVEQVVVATPPPPSPPPPEVKVTTVEEKVEPVVETIVAKEVETKEKVSELDTVSMDKKKPAST